MKGSLREEKIPSLLHHTFYSMDLSQTIHLSLSGHALQKA